MSKKINTSTPDLNPYNFCKKNKLKKERMLIK